MITYAEGLVCLGMRAKSDAAIHRDLDHLIGVLRDDLVVNHNSGGFQLAHVAQLLTSCMLGQVRVLATRWDAHAAPGS